MRWVSGLSAALVALVLWTAGAAKAENVTAFAKFLHEHHGMPQVWAAIATGTLIASEFLLPVLLITRFQRFARVALTLLFSFFSFYNLNRLLFDPQTPCSCFGKIATLPPGAMLVLDLALLGMCVFALGAWHELQDFRHAIGNYTRKAKPLERTLQGVMMLGLSVMVPATLSRALVAQPPALQEVILDPQLLQAGGHTILGSPQAPVRLVVFGDYQCPPCRALQKDLVKLDPSTFRVIWRQLPITGLHPKAEAAAIWAESQPNYAEAHAKLMSLSTDLPIDLAISKDRQKLATWQVERDIQDAQSLKLRGTPTVYAIRSGRVYRVVDASDLSRIDTLARSSGESTTTTKRKL